jgi:hypothetical protein
VVLSANQYLGQAYEAQGNYRRAIDYTVASLDRTRLHERFDQVFLPAVISRGQSLRGRRVADRRGSGAPRERYARLSRAWSAGLPPG